MNPEKLESYLMQVAPVETSGARQNKDYTALLNGACGAVDEIKKPKPTRGPSR